MKFLLFTSCFCFILIISSTIATETIYSEAPLKIFSNKKSEETPTATTSSSSTPASSSITPPPLILPALVAEHLKNVSSLFESIQKEQFQQISEQAHLNSGSSTAAGAQTSTTTSTTPKADKIKARKRRQQDGDDDDDDTGYAGEVADDSVTGVYQYPEYFEPPSAASNVEYN